MEYMKELLVVTIRNHMHESDAQGKTARLHVDLRLEMHKSQVLYFEEIYG